MKPDAATTPERWATFRRTAVVTGCAVGLCLLATAGVVYLFAIRQLGYAFFDLSDIPVYFETARAMAGGLRPYVDFPLEYPPLAALLFTIPADTSSIGGYAPLFALLMQAIAAGTALVTGAAAARVWQAGRAPYVSAAGFAAAVLAAGAILANRYDVAVALVIAAFLLCTSHRWYTAGAIVLGTGFALKLVPAILLPLLLVLAARPAPSIRAGAGFAVAAALPFAAYLPEGLGGLQQLFGYHAMRPLQVESVLATPIFAGHLLGLVDVRIGNAFGSQYVAAAGARALAQISGLLMVGALAAAYALVWRRRGVLRDEPEHVPLAATAVLLAFLTSGKVLSPQFLVWLLPCIALVLPSRPVLGALLLLALGLTQLEFPANYWAFVELRPAAVACVVARNLVLLAAFAVALIALWRLPAQPRPR